MSWFRTSKDLQPAQHEGHEVENELSTKGPYGIELCHDPENAVVDVIFVHGLTGNRRNTWTSKPENIFWPKDLLPRDLPNARIMTYGYDADIVHFWSMASQNRIGEHAGNLVNAVVQIRERTDTENRPIIFVTHSLGGLVTEDALLFSKNSAEEHLQDLIRSVVGILFLGTPHCGSNLANWGSVMGSLVNAIKTANVDLVNVLKTDSEVLARVQREFHTMLRGPTFEGKPPLKITCFFEELPVRGTGEIVPKHSAILSSYNAIGIRANHMDMTKYSGVDDTGYGSVSGELRRWVKALTTRGPEYGRPGEAPSGFMGASYPSDREGDRYGHYPTNVRGYPYGVPPQEPSPYDERGRGQQPYPYAGDMYQPPPPHQNHPQHPPVPWGTPQYSSPPPSSGPRYAQPESYGPPAAYSPNYQRYRTEGGGYSRALPPPEPRFTEDAAPMASPPPMHQQDPRWDARSPPPSQGQGAYVYQGANVVTNNGSQTYGNGKMVQGNNMHVGGNVSF